MFEFEDIYNVLIGNNSYEFAADWVHDGNREDSPYARAYQEVLDACQRLRIRLGVGEYGDFQDDDMDVLMDAVSICRKQRHLKCSAAVWRSPQKFISLKNKGTWQFPLYYARCMRIYQNLAGRMCGLLFLSKTAVRSFA